MRSTFILLLCTLLSAAAQPVLINEVMTSNGSTLKDENGDSPDWIELFNAGSTEVSLAGYGLSDSATQPFKWVFRSGKIPTHGFLLVYASGKDRQPGESPVVIPSALPGLRVWLSADGINLSDPSQVRIDGANAFVTQWNDQSGSSFNAQQTSESLQPLFISSSPDLNAKPAVRFDGANDLLLLPNVPGTNNFCIIAVMKAALPHEIDPESSSGVGGIAGQHWLFGARHGGDLDGGAGVSVGTNGISVYEHGSFYMPALAVLNAPVGPGFSVVSINYANKQPSIALQGTVARTGLASPRRNVMAPVEIGSGVYGAFNGEIAEILIYDRALSDGERRSVEEYLAQKYALHFTGVYHTSFSLNAGGEKVYLTNPDAVRADEFPKVAMPRDISYGRQPDGAANFFFFTEPTPGGANSTPGSSEFIPPVKFSVPGGFYTNAFALTLTNESAGAVIHYTVDGSEPTVASAIYNGPLNIKSRAGTPNSISTIPTGGGWQPPAGEVFKAWVTRARAFKEGALPSEISTHTYLVYPKQKYTLPVISIATEKAGFFDPQIGIYVPGNAPGGNYFQRGPAWERAAHIEFFERDGALAFSQDVGVKIHGNTSRQFPQKALGIDARYGASRSPIKYRLFPGRSQKEYENFVLRQSGHDYFYTFIRDAMMHKLVEPLGVETQDVRPAIVFLNGEYWGIHNIRETEDKYFLAEHGGVDPNNIDFLEGYVAANEGDANFYTAMLDFLSKNDLTFPNNYARAQRFMDTDNYAIYKVAEIFEYRWDIGNHRLWRPRTPEGRFRWMQFDDDVGWGGFWAVQPAWSFNMLAYDTEPNGPWTQYEGNPGGNDHNNPTTTFLLRKLLESPTFKRDFLNRFADMLNTVFHPSNTTNLINQMTSVIAPEMAEHINRWRAPASLAVWQANVQYLRDYANKRPAFARQHLIQKFGLGGSVNLTLSVSRTNAGVIKLNSLTLASPTNTPWSGSYFKNNAISLTALPAPGYKFIGWPELPGTETNSVTLLLNGDFSLSATFRPDDTAILRFNEIQKTIGGVRFNASGAPGASYRLEISSDLANWNKLQDSSADELGEIHFERAFSTKAEFYRLLLN